VKHRSLLSAVIRHFASHSLPPVNPNNLGDLYSIIDYLYSSLSKDLQQIKMPHYLIEFRFHGYTKNILKEEFLDLLFSAVIGVISTHRLPNGS